LDCSHCPIAASSVPYNMALFYEHVEHYLQERETKLQGVLNLMVKNFEAVAPQQDKDSLITNALRGDVQLQEEARVSLPLPCYLTIRHCKMQCPHWGFLTQFLC